MAAPVPLLPLDSSLPSSVLSSGGEEVSSARQRRRRTTRKPGIEALARSVVTLGEGGLELDTFERSVSTRDRASRSQTGHQEGKSEFNRTGTTPMAVKSKKELASQPSLELNGKVRKKRSHHREKKLKKQTEGISHPTRKLGDSTDGVASLLQQQLNATEQDDTGKGKMEVIVNQGAELRPQFDSAGGAGGGGHSSGVVTECEEDANQGSSGTSDQPGRPLPPPAIKLEHADGNDAPPGPDKIDDDSSEILGITIHGTDELQASVFLTHPSVRVSIFDASIENFGLLLKKSAPEKCVTSYYERGNPSVDYILPIMTQPFECRQHRMRTGTLTSQWEETLTFNERPSHFTGNENVVICFELLDFISSGGIGRGQSQQKPWHRIAWAFLRPGGKTCRSRMGKRIRLQLYKYPKKIFGHSTEGTEVYDLWSRHYRSTYPSTLYVTLSKISTALPQETLPEPSTRSFDPLQAEQGSLTFERLMEIHLANKNFSGVSGPPSSTMVSASQRLPGQPCQIPTSPLSTQYPTPMGCSTLAFSHSGRLLAAGCADQPPLYPLVIYEVPSFKPVLVLEGHRGIIYTVCWSADDSILVSASADGLVNLWSLDGGSSKPRATLPHPCYVYCVCFITGQQWKDSIVLATGAYDGYVRIWSFDKDDNTTQIIGEFHGHSGHVNCLVWSENASRLYAGDSKGIMGVWHRKNGTWMLRRKVDVLNGQSLIAMQLHPNSRKMLLHAQKSKVAMLDLRVDHISCDYVGIQPAGLERCASVLSPCGGLVFAGSPTGTVYTWNADTGKELHIYSGLSISGAVGALAYHPTQHMLAISSFGSCQPLHVFNHLKGDVATQPKALPTDRLGGGASLSIPKWSARGKEVGDGGAVSSSSSVRGSSVSLAGLAASQGPFKGSQKISDLVNTLDRITTAKS